MIRTGSSTSSSSSSSGVMVVVVFVVVVVMYVKISGIGVQNTDKCHNYLSLSNACSSVKRVPTCHICWLIVKTKLFSFFSFFFSFLWGGGISI